MPGKTEDNLNILTSSNDHQNNIHNNNNTMNPDNGSGGNAIYTIHAMGASNTDRYLSNESLETNSSSESNSTLGNIPHRKDHEFIPTRMKQINASKPAADPKQFTRVPSNPLLVSAQKQLMMVEEVKKAKELVQPKVKGGDDEPDWQNNLSTWKNRRRKQSEEALQRVSEVKALEDGEFEPAKKSSIGRKLSALLYTAPEDDWSDLGLEKTPPIHKTSDTTNKHNFNNNSRTHSRTSLISPTNQSSIREEEDDSEREEEDEPNLKNKSNSSFNNVQHQKSTTPSEARQTVTPPVAKPPPEKIDSKGDHHVSRPKAAIPSDKIETAPLVPVGVLNKKFSEASLASSSNSKPIVTFTNQESTNAPPVRRKSSELSTTMKSRLEAFIAPLAAGTEAKDKPVDHAPEPDEKFHEKLQTFRKISEGPKEEEQGPRKPKLSYSSLIGNNFSQSNLRTLPHESDEEDNDDSVDKMLDDALEESYRSVLEDSDNKNDSLGSQEDKNVIFKGDDFLPASVVRKAPPSEKPPPPPPSEPPMVKKEEPPRQIKVSKPPTVLDDEEIDKQEQEIIASLEMEEKEHKKYMETVQAMKTVPPPPKTEEKSMRKSSSLSPLPDDYPSQKMSSSISQPQLANSAPTTKTQIASKKRPSEGGNQKSYNSQHWLIQEAEQRRLAEFQQPRVNKQPISPATSSPASSLKSQTSPVYENLNNPSQTVRANNYTNHQRPDSSVSPDQNWQTRTNNFYPQENLYANLGSVPPPPQPTFETSPVHFQREPQNNHGRLPGPQIPPRLQPERQPAQTDPKGSGERMLSVSGKKKCSHCKEELGRGAAMIIESLRLFYHLRCFQCCVCHLQLGNGTAGTDVRVRNNKLHCQNCYSNDEGLKFSKV